MNDRETNPVPKTEPVGNSARLKPQFFCRYCDRWKFEIDRLPTSRQGNFICADCDDKRNRTLAEIQAKKEAEL